MNDDTPFFMNSLDEKDHIWTITMLGGGFTGTLVWCQRDVNYVPIMISVETKAGKIVEIPWTAIQCITYEGVKNG